MSYGTDTVMQVTPVSGNNNNGWGGFGGDGAWWIIVLFLFAFNGGWGNGWGGGGMNGGVGSEVQRGFDTNTIVNKLDGISQGICDSTYALNNTMTNGFHGVDNAICNLGYQTQQGFNNTNIALMQGQHALSTQLADCCCTTQRAIDGVNYNMATQACDTRNTIQNVARDIIDSQNNGTRAVLDALTAQRIEAKDETIARQNQQIFQLQLAASQSAQNTFITANQEAQTAELIRRLGVGCPQPAFLVNAPTPVNFPTNACGQVTFGGNCYGGCAA